MSLIRPACIAMLANAALALSAHGGGADCGDWIVTPTPVPDPSQHMIIRDLVAVATDDVWAAGGWSGIVDDQFQTFGFAMHWDGKSWTLTDVPQPAPCAQCHNITLWGVDATGPDDVWAAGGALKQAPDGFVGTHIHIMHWDGSRWKVLETPVQSGASGDFIWDVEAIAPDDVWFFGENLYSGFPLLLDLAIALHWDGDDFEFVEVPIVNFQSSGFGDGNSLHSGDALAPDDMWAVGAGGDGDPISCNLSQIHHWDGESWTHVPSQAPDGCFDHSLYAVEMISSDDVWAGGEYFDGNYHGLALHWDGSTWTEVPTPIGIADFVAFASDDVWAFGGGIAHWDGASWTLVETFPEINGPTFAGADAAGDCDIWAGGRQLADVPKIFPLAVHLVPDTTSPSPDLNGDGLVDGADLGTLLGAWGQGAHPADLSQDGVVDGADLGILLGTWGPLANR